MIDKVILLVEDNSDDELLILDALEENRIQNKVVVARNGVEALDFLLGSSEHTDDAIKDLPAVVLLDLKLPKIDGLEVLRRIRENGRTQMLPVVILTSSKEEEDRIRGYALGANSYVRKPVNFDNFLNVVKQLGLYWLLLNEAPPTKGNIYEEK